MKRFLYLLLSILFFALAGLSQQVFASDGLNVHFIDVGQADACLITCDNQAMMIDGGDASDSQLIYAYLKKQNITYLDYIVATHGDADHVGGLSAAVSYAKANIGTVFAPYTDSEKERFQTFKKKLAENGKSITVPATGSKYKLGGATFQILSSGGRGDNESIVLRLTYGAHSFLFMGDADSDQEKAILRAEYPVESTVLKVGHHGSTSSTCYQFLRAVYPAYAVISVGTGNSYGHPTDEVLSRLRDCQTSVFRTDNNGTILFQSDGKTLSYTAEKTVNFEKNLIAPETASAAEGTKNQAETEPESKTSPSKTQTYILNTNTRKFHLPGCSSVSAMKEKNKKEVEDTREAIISQGYAPCKRCNP